MSKAGYKLIQDDVVVADVSGADRDSCLREIMHYAMLYAQDGQCTVKGASDEDWDALRALTSAPPRCPHAP